MAKEYFHLQEQYFEFNDETFTVTLLICVTPIPGTILLTIEDDAT